MDAVETVVNYGILSLVPPCVGDRAGIADEKYYCIIVCNGICKLDDYRRF